MKRGSLEAKIVAQKGQRIAVMNLSGSIGLPHGFHAHEFIEMLTGLGEYDVLYAVMDSPGGSPTDAWTIFNFLGQPRQKRSSSLILIIGECSGDALLIALGFDQILMRPDAFMGFHPLKFRSLSATRRVTHLTARLVAERVNCQIDDVFAWIDKNKTFTAEECLARSLCDAIV
jgi:ATP-dependent protease ClpP protease subunit